jgi:hypothetical protein
VIESVTKDVTKATVPVKQLALWESGEANNAPAPGSPSDPMQL